MGDLKLKESSLDSSSPLENEGAQDGGSLVFSKKETDSSPNLSLLNPLHWKPMITRRLDTSHTAVATTYTIIAAFSAYFMIYGIKSSLFAATFTGMKVFGSLDLKVAFSISQTLSYGVSKVAGAVYIPMIKREQRFWVLILLAILSEAPLVIFGVVPPVGQVIMVFLSGLPMAWMWGIMVMYLEGRRTSDFLLMGLYLSVMVASGVAKSIGAAVMQGGVSETWMPAVCGAFSAVAFMIFIYMLDAVPEPTEKDKKKQGVRSTMSQAEARRFLLKWAPGFLLITLVYSLLGAYRNFRDYFAPELWLDLEGPNFNPSVFTQSELPVGVCTAVAYSLLYYIKDNKKAFFSILGIMFLGGVVVLFATIIQSSGHLDPLAWMITVGVGLYMAYIPPGAMLYDRFNGAIGQPFTSVFMIYLSDICGYAATLAILFYRNFGDAKVSWVAFFRSLSFVASLATMAGMAVATVYFFVAMRAKPACISPPSLEEGLTYDETNTQEETKEIEGQTKEVEGSEVQADERKEDINMENLAAHKTTEEGQGEDSAALSP